MNKFNELIKKILVPDRKGKLAWKAVALGSGEMLGNHQRFTCVMKSFFPKSLSISNARFRVQLLR